MHSVLVAGSLDEVVDLIERTRRECQYSWSVSGVCIPGATTADRPREVHGVPVVGGLGDVSEPVLRGGYRAVVAHDAHWTRRRLRDLAWDLEGAPAPPAHLHLVGGERSPPALCCNLVRDLIHSPVDSDVCDGHSAIHSAGSGTNP
jgi:hypothetical protein